MKPEVNIQSIFSPGNKAVIAFLLFAGIAVFFLWAEHKVHILGALPFVLLLLCPLIHIFMHKGHGHGSQHETQHNHSTKGGLK